MGARINNTLVHNVVFLAADTLLCVLIVNVYSYAQLCNSLTTSIHKIFAVNQL